MELNLANLNQKNANTGGVLNAIVVYTVTKTIGRKDGSANFAKMLLRLSTKEGDGFWGILTGPNEAMLRQISQPYAVGAVGKLKHIQMSGDKYLNGKVVNFTQSTKPGTRSTLWAPLKKGDVKFAASPECWPTPPGDLSSLTHVTAATFGSLIGKVVEVSDVKPPDPATGRKDPVRDVVLKDGSHTLVEVALWGCTLTGLEIKENDVLLIDNAKVRPGTTEGKVKISCEYWGDSAMGNCIVQVNPRGEITEELRAVQNTGGQRISDEWVGGGRVPIDADGEAQVLTASYLRVANEKDVHELPQPGQKIQKLAETFRFQLHACFLSEVRTPTLYIECSTCKTKIDETTNLCKKAARTRTPHSITPGTLQSGPFERCWTDIHDRLLSHSCD